MEKNKAAQDLRAIPSDKRTAAVKRNLAIARAARPLKACACHVARPDGTHESSCPVYLRERQRASRARKQ